MKAIKHLKQEEFEHKTALPAPAKQPNAVMMLLHLYDKLVLFTGMVV